MGIFKNGKGPSETAWTGQEVHINPTAAQNVRRNLGRLKRLEIKLSKLSEQGLNRTERFSLLKREFNARKAIAELNDIRGD